MLHGIWLVIELGQDILPTNIFTKFDNYTTKTIEVIGGGGGDIDCSIMVYMQL